VQYRLIWNAKNQGQFPLQYSGRPKGGRNWERGDKGKHQKSGARKDLSQNGNEHVEKKRKERTTEEDERKFSFHQRGWPKRRTSSLLGKGRGKIPCAFLYKNENAQ